MSPVSSKTLIIFASSLQTNEIEENIKERYDVQFLRFRGVPKGLLPISGKPALSWLVEWANKLFPQIYILTNAYNFKHFERWASGVNFPRENILNSGLGSSALSDLAFVHRVKQIQNDIVITSAELFYNDSNLHNLLYATPHFILCTETNKMPFAFGMSQDSLNHLDSHNELNTQQVQSNWQTEIKIYITQQSSTTSIAVLDEQQNASYYDYVDPKVSLKSYLNHWRSALDQFKQRSNNDGSLKLLPLHQRAYARVGLMGNPSDGFYGKTLSLLISNFWAEVTLIPHEQPDITILPNPVSDPHQFSSLECLVGVSKIDGYETGDRLLQACCKVFYCYCQEYQIAIDTQQGFKMMFETNIPRQVGLAGSSAIITALWKILSIFYGVTEIPLEVQASLVLKVEQDELGIAAGLQDRVIQAFGGLVYMDFDRDYMEKHGHGKYQSLNINLLPKLWLAYVADPEDSGKVHNTVKQRFLNGDQEVIQAMKKFASFTDQAKESLESGDCKRFAKLMSANFDLRRATYGDAVVGASNMRMIELAKEHQCVAKFTGSGGAVVGMWNGEDKAEEKKDLLQLRRDLESEGYVFIELSPMVYE